MSSLHSSEEKEKHQISQSEYAADPHDIQSVTPEEEKRIVRKIDFKVMQRLRVLVRTRGNSRLTRN